MTSQEEIQYYWKKKTISILDLVYADGKVIIFEENCCRKKYNITYEGTLEAYKHKVDFPFFDDDTIQIFDSETNPLNGNIVHFGACCMENEGFLAYTDNQDKLLWSMFFDFSNPFIATTIIDNRIIVRTIIENNLIFTIPVDNPEKISCVPTESFQDYQQG